MIGELDRRIEIYTITETVNAYGEKVTANVLYRTVWAQMASVNANEGIEGKKITASEVVKFTVRYHSGYNEKMKIYFNNTWYNILGIQQLDRKRYQDITAERKY